LCVGLPAESKESSMKCSSGIVTVVGADLKREENEYSTEERNQKKAYINSISTTIVANTVPATFKRRNEISSTTCGYVATTAVGTSCAASITTTCI
jgi:hypothetical protein